MTSLANVRLAAARSKEEYGEYLDQKTYFDKLERDQANADLWSAYIGNALFAIAFLKSGNLGYAQGAKKIGGEIAHWITEQTGYVKDNLEEWGEISDPGAFNRQKDLENIQTVETALKEQQVIEDTAYLTGIGSGILSLGMGYAQGLEAAPDVLTVPEQAEGFEVAGGTAWELAEDGSRIFEWDAQELSEIGLEIDSSGTALQGIEGQWDPILTEGGRIFDPGKGDFVMPKFFQGIMPGGKPWQFGDWSAQALDELTGEAELGSLFKGVHGAGVDVFEGIGEWLAALLDSGRGRGPAGAGPEGIPLGVQGP